jgi:DNA-binding IclR family transcriptional regulator|nr:MAG TPA: antitoxin [Caudoviricetes sp.]
MRKDREIGILDMISARIRPDETLFLEEMSEALNISKSEAIRVALMITRKLLQDEETGKINREIIDRFKDTPPL